MAAGRRRRDRRRPEPRLQEDHPGRGHRPRPGRGRPRRRPAQGLRPPPLRYRRSVEGTAPCVPVSSPSPPWPSPLAACSTVAEAVHGPRAGAGGLSRRAGAACEQPLVSTARARARSPPAPTPCGAPARAPSSTTSGRGRVGDILTVMIDIDDSAKTTNATTSARTTAITAGVPHLLRPGVRASGKILPGGFDPANAHRRPTPRPANAGAGSVNRAGEDQPDHRRGGHRRAAQRQPGDPGHPGGAHQHRAAPADRRRHRAAGGHLLGQHHPPHPDRRGAHQLRRPRRHQPRPEDAPAARRWSRRFSPF